MRPYKITYGLTTDDADGICQSQTPGAAGNLTINGALATSGVATLTSTNCTQRRVRITCAGADSARTFTVYGTQAGGAQVVEEMAGSGGSTTDSRFDYATVTRVAVDAATAGAVTVGTNTLGSTPWYLPDIHAKPFAIGIGAVVSGTVNYDIQHTFDNVLLTNGRMAVADATLIPDVFDHSDLAGETASQNGNYAFPCQGIRLEVNSGTGTVEFTLIQGGLGGM